MNTPQIDIQIEDNLWNGKIPNGNFVENLLISAQRLAKAPADYELSVLLSTDAHIRQLNRQYRDKDSATNVLSFPQNDTLPPQSGQRPHLGDMVLAFETLEREAKAQGKAFEHHLAHLLIHGFLHLLGYTHDHDSRALQMEGLERDILQKAGYPNPYAQDMQELGSDE